MRFINGDAASTLNCNRLVVNELKLARGSLSAYL